MEVREKWTLIPTVEFSTGRTVEDGRLLLGATEYNVLGRADQLTVNLFREERGFGASLAFGEHPFRRRRWTIGREATIATAGYRFESGTSWDVFRSGGAMVFTSAPLLSEHFNVRVRGTYFYEATSARFRLADRALRGRLSETK